MFLEFIASLWWLLAFAILFPLAKNTWLSWRQKKYEHDLKFVLLELRIPREIKKSPRAMEQVLRSLHALRNAPGDLREYYWDGEVTRWFSLELVSLGGEIHFYIRTPKQYRDLVEAAFFSYYQDVEVVEAERDYLEEHVPRTMEEVYAKGYDLWGAEMELRKSDAYPIKTYLDFESPDEDKQYDPIAAFLEVLGKVKKPEFVGVQILIAAAPPSWGNKFETLIATLKDRKDKLERSRLGTGAEFPGGPLPALSVTKGGGAGEDQVLARALIQRTPGETDVLKAIEDNISLPAFETLVRFFYLSPTELYYDSFPRRGVAGAFNQYESLNLNAFERNRKVETRTRIWYWPHIFPGIRAEYRKQRLLYNYRHLENPPHFLMGKLATSFLFNWNFGSHRFLMNVRGLASVFHPPTILVLTAPHIKRVESRKAGPPAGLAIFGEEEQLMEKFEH